MNGLQSFLQFLGDYASMALVAIFLENTILTRALGTSTALLIVRKKHNFFLFGVILTIITSLSAIIVWLLNPLIADYPYKYYIRPLLYVTVIGVAYVVTLIFTNRVLKKSRKQILPMIHLAAFNCAVLGALLLGMQDDTISFAGFLGFGLGTGIGFILANFLIMIAYTRLNSSRVPKAFRGFPAMLLYIGILSLAFYGLIGHELPF